MPALSWSITSRLSSARQSLPRRASASTLGKVQATWAVLSISHPLATSFRVFTRWSGVRRKPPARCCVHRAILVVSCGEGKTEMRALASEKPASPPGCKPSGLRQVPFCQLLNSFVLVPRCAARCAVGCHLMYPDFSRAVLYTHGRGSARAPFSLGEETPSSLRRAGLSSSSATDAHEERKAT